MSSNDNNSGLMSNAGLVRYFDQHSSNQVMVNPKTVTVIGVCLAVVGILLNVFI